MLIIVGLVEPLVGVIMKTVAEFRKVLKTLKTDALRDLATSKQIESDPDVNAHFKSIQLGKLFTHHAVLCKFGLSATAEIVYDYINK